MAFDTYALLGASSATALLVGLWGRIKALATRALSHVVTINRIDKDLALIVIAHLNRHHQRSPFGERFFSANGHHIRPLKRRGMVAVRLYHRSTQLFWIGWNPVLVSMNWGTGGERAPVPSNSSSNDSEFPCTVSCLRGMVAFEPLLKTALDEHNERTASVYTGGRYGVVRLRGRSGANGPQAPESNYPPTKDGEGGRVSGAADPVGWSWDDLGPEQSTSAMSALALTDELERVAEEVRFWKRSRDWYVERGIPWRRGYGFTGSPGTGKTSFARALAEELDLPVYAFDLASMQNHEFLDCWRTVLNSMPCMVLLEDIDAVFHGRENISGTPGGLSFDLLLNCLDGIERPDGLLLIVTTNNPEHVDPALGCSPKSYAPSRPGRIDRVVEFQPLTAEGRRKIALRIVRDERLAEQLTASGHNDTAAQFQERCFRVALAQLFPADNVRDIASAPSAKAEVA